MSHHEPIIVVVDPDPDRATALSSELDRRGYHVFRRSSGIDALECVSEQLPDVVLSESELLDVESLELVRSIHETSPSTRIMFVDRRGGKPHVLRNEESWNPEAMPGIDEEISFLIGEFREK